MKTNTSNAARSYQVKKESTYAEVIVEDVVKATNCLSQLSLSSAILQDILLHSCGSECAKINCIGLMNC